MSSSLNGQSSSPRERILFAGGLAALLVAGVVLRLHDLGLPAYDCDELYALSIQGTSIKAVASVVGRSAFHDLSPPLSYLLFLPWIALFGTAEAAVRSLPLLLGSISIALLGLLGRRIGGVWAGLAGAAFLASNPLHIAYSQEARPYALAVALTIAAHLFFVRSLGGTPGRNRIVYALLVVAAIYTHYYAVFALLPHGLLALWLLLTGDESSRRAARPTLLAFACAMATFIAWLPAVVFQSALPLEIYDLGDSPLRKAGRFLKNVAGLAGPPFILPATAALLVLLAFALLWRQRLPAAAAQPASAGLPPRRLGALLLLAGLLLAAGLPTVVSRYLLPAARHVLVAEGIDSGAIERELRAFLQFTVSLPLSLGAIGLLIVAWPWISSLPERLPRMSSGQGRPLTINVLLATLLLAPAATVLILALGGVPSLSERNLLICEPPLALALGVGTVRLAKVRGGRLALVPVVLCLLLARFQYQPVSGLFGVRGSPLGHQTGAWRDLVRELDRRGGRDLPLVLVRAPRSDPANFYLRDRPFRRIETGPVATAGLPGEFRFVHLKGNKSSEALLAGLSGVVSLEPRLELDEFAIYDARLDGRSGRATAQGRSAG